MSLFPNKVLGCAFKSREGTGRVHLAEGPVWGVMTGEGKAVGEVGTQRVGHGWPEEGKEDLRGEEARGAARRPQEQRVCPSLPQL